MSLEIILVIVLWLILAPILYKTFKGFLSESSEEKADREHKEKKKREEEREFKIQYEKFEEDRKIKLEQETKQREAEGRFLFDAPSKELEKPFAERAAYYANKGMDMPYPTEKEIEEMRNNLKKNK